MNDEERMTNYERCDDGRFADMESFVVIFCAGFQKSARRLFGHDEIQLNRCADVARRLADVLLFGVPPFDVVECTELFKMFVKNLQIHTSVNPDFQTDFPLAMRWIAEKRIDVLPIVTHSFPVTEVQEAFELFRDRRDGALKVFLKFPS